MSDDTAPTPSGAPEEGPGPDRGVTPSNAHIERERPDDPAQAADPPPGGRSGRNAHIEGGTTPP